MARSDSAASPPRASVGIRGVGGEEAETPAPPPEGRIGRSRTSPPPSVRPLQNARGWTSTPPRSRIRILPHTCLPLPRGALPGGALHVLRKAPASAVACASPSRRVRAATRAFLNDPPGGIHPLPAKKEAGWTSQGFLPPPPPLSTPFEMPPSSGTQLGMRA